MMATGLPAFASQWSRASLLVLNYHRIWAPGQATSAYDDGVFDSNFETFRRQMQWLRSATHVLDEDGLLSLGDLPRLPNGRLYTLVTFDDGYIDCFTLVKPVLDSLGIKGIFFIPVEILETRRLGWWDIAAYLLKKSDREAIEVDGRVFALGQRIHASLRLILNQFKLEKAEHTESLLAKLSAACGVELPTKDQQSAELMDWSQVCRLRDSGHAIGSHAWSHRALATLQPEQQAMEIRESRRELHAILAREIHSFAYPVGGPQHFNQISVELVRDAGYRQAFTFNTGMSSLPLANRFQIPRESAKSLPTLKAKALMPRFMGLRARRVV
jgi:peptidoglycan/xylan/chitin deacetylase (PgdA/CDA1 family)